MTSKVRVLAIIPARGGSKGIPRKNLQPVAGLPLVARSVLAAKSARLVDRVVVSTDDPEIAQVARAHGADVVKRPADLSTDTAPSEPALLHVLQELEATENYRPDLLAFLQCTSPLTQPEDVDGTIQALLDANADTSLAVTSFHGFLWRPDRRGAVEPLNHDKIARPRRQDLPPQFLETGAIYVMRAAEFRKVARRFFGKTVPYVMPPHRSIDVDEPDDLILADAAARTLETGAPSRFYPGKKNR